MRGYACIGLDNPKTSSNVGGVLRAAYVYGAAMVAISGTRYHKAATDTPCGYRYVHPERAYYIFGAEDATLDHNVLSWCRDIVYIPTKYCMNLAATVNVVLYDRLAKTN